MLRKETALLLYPLRMLSVCLYVFVGLWVCVSGGYLKKLTTNFDEILGGVGVGMCFDFGVDSNHDVHSGIFKRNFYTLRGRAILRIY